MEELKNEQELEKKAPLCEEQMEEAAPSFLGWPQASKKKRNTKKGKKTMVLKKTASSESNPHPTDGTKKNQPYWPNQNLDPYG